MTINLICSITTRTLTTTATSTYQSFSFFYFSLDPIMSEVIFLVYDVIFCLVDFADFFDRPWHCQLFSLS